MYYINNFNPVGNLFTKSESKTEDLLAMMTEVQEFVNTYEDEESVTRCYERKIVSGDNKTEKNMHYGILRLVHRTNNKVGRTNLAQLTDQPKAKARCR